MKTLASNIKQLAVIIPGIHLSAFFGALKRKVAKQEGGGT